MKVGRLPSVHGRSDKHVTEGCQGHVTIPRVGKTFYASILMVMNVLTVVYSLCGIFGV